SSRWRAGTRNLRGLAPALSLCLAIMAGSGAWYYYNAHVRNVFRTSKQQRGLAAEYERRYKKWERLPQPKVTDVDAEIEIYPERRSMAGRGHYLLINRTAAVITEVHVTNAKESVNEVRFDRASSIALDDRQHFYTIYKLARPLAPGEQMRMDFRLGYESR